MRKALRLTLLGLVVLPVIGSAAIVISQASTIQSAWDGVRTWNNKFSTYRAYLENDSATDEAWINSMSFSPTAGDWSGMAVEASNLFTSDTVIPLGANSGRYYGFLGGMFNVAQTGTVTPGMYSGTVNILGGTTSSSTDVLVSHNFSLEVLAQSPTFTQTNLNPAQTTTPGGHSDYRVRLETGADSVWQWAYHSQYSPGLANATLDFLSWPSSNNFDAVMAPNSTWEGDVVRWNAASNTPNGTLQAGIGFMGGKYVGDLNFISDQRFTWTVVPEPTGLLALGLATALLLRKRRG